MGNVQSLMIILAIVIVGVSIAVGTTYYKQQHINTSRQICFSELNEFASMAKAWWNTPLEQGGGGKTISLSSTGNIDNLGVYIGYNYQSGNNTFTTLNASYQIQDGGDHSVTFECTSNVQNNGSPMNILFTYNMKTDESVINIVN